MAVRFDADGEDYTRTTNLPSGTTFTVACWAKISTDRNTFTTVWSLDGGTSDYVYMQTNGDGTTMKVEADGFSTGTVAMTVGTWYFLAYTLSGGTGTFYYASVSAAALSSASNTLGTTSPTAFRIGESPFGAEWLNGAIQGMRVWSGVALTAAELDNERWSAIPVRTDSLHFWFPFDVASTTDYSGNGYTLSGGSGATTEDGPPILWADNSFGLVPAPPAATEANAEAATATGAAEDATSSVAPTAEAAEATGAAHDPTVTIAQDVLAETATATAEAFDVQPAAGAPAELSTATAVAHDATVTTSPFRFVLTTREVFGETTEEQETWYATEVIYATGYGTPGQVFTIVNGFFWVVGDDTGLTFHEDTGVYNAGRTTGDPGYHVHLTIAPGNTGFNLWVALEYEITYT